MNEWTNIEQIKPGSIRHSVFIDEKKEHKKNFEIWTYNTVTIELLLPTLPRYYNRIE